MHKFRNIFVSVKTLLFGFTNLRDYFILLLTQAIIQKHSFNLTFVTLFRYFACRLVQNNIYKYKYVLIDCDFASFKCVSFQ